MQPMTGQERIYNILNRQPVDRIGVFEHFWNDTYRIWQEKGILNPTKATKTTSTTICNCCGHSTW